MTLFNRLLLMINSFGNRDVPEPWQLSLQDAASPVMEEIVFFHDQIMFILILIIVAVIWLIIKALSGQSYYRYLIDGVLLETIWTVIPAIILVFIAFPSLKLLYLMDEVMDPALTIKAIGHQWYWSYEYSDYQAETLEFDSYMIPTSDLNSGDFRLLEVDNRLVVPINTHVRILVTGADVLHSFSVPALGLKMDAVPGRLNQTGLFIKRPGVFYGQCSEICGANHSFMPIVVEAVSLNRYVNWVLSSHSS
uniref:Cytochrome c oxidase subunit 2 n=5 Tax=Schizopathidae TaxID=223214 RepID=A0A6M4RGG6_9CNID|nr:cytochrome c oxidase subunit II [Bathypathes sp. n. 2 NB-2020]QJS34472.1 cytochrome c oxidase subunit II [Bathypathes sp. n. 3 NB-2020]QJS34485.1 cytochrome c oxidase subunit II [Bathypathes sp. 1 NB-2020]QJS34619.1 cytochrome c oxidase subunit II [Stauropathes arctica]QJS34632.1 cytochrome c oxidase subunit II [Stauropathes cf. punctata NB-2020]WRM53902.1 cytochrome c oxidase subunit II [Bathypathes sp. 1 YY-2024]WRM53915.1 cytochrome c oxidase subunit II [Bathypathes sp. 2 YY-2024]